MLFLFPIALFLIILLAIGTISIIFFRKKSSSTKPCSTSCANKGCSEKNNCGESCESQVCSPDEKCYKGNCCTPKCNGVTCGENSDDGCGGTCSCLNGQICYQGSCCTPPDCSNGKCSDEEICGIKCSCNSSYCQQDCCKDGKCIYQDICNSPNGPLLKSQWGKFCNSCTNCSLQNATFYKDSSIPISGTITCASCTRIDGSPGKATSININKDSCFYDQHDGLLYESPGSCVSCNSYLCWNDADCQRNGCNSCVEGKCS